jgi:hypothetical protein
MLAGSVAGKVIGRLFPSQCAFLKSSGKLRRIYEMAKDEE